MKSMKFFFILFLSCFIFSSFSEAKTSLAEIYRAKAEYDKAVKELVKIVNKYGKNSPQYKKNYNKYEKTKDEFYKKATDEYWEAMSVKADIKGKNATTTAEFNEAQSEWWEAISNRFEIRWQRCENNSDKIIRVFNKFNYSEYKSKILKSQSDKDYMKTLACTTKTNKPNLQPCLKQNRKEKFRRTCVAQAYFHTCGKFMKCLIKNNWQSKNPKSLRIMHKQCLFNNFAKFLDPYVSVFEAVDALYKDKNPNRQLSSETHK